MRIGEVSLNTNDVIILANFYKKLLGIDNGSNDEIHQTLISEKIHLRYIMTGQTKIITIQISVYHLQWKILRLNIKS